MNNMDTDWASQRWDLSSNKYKFKVKYGNDTFT